jgi:DNA-binding transcriptional LysR family regulator
VEVETLAEDELMLACGSRSQWTAAFADPSLAVEAREVSGWPLVLPGADAAIRKRWDELLRRKVPSALPTVAIEVGGWRVLLGYVQAGFGVGLLPRSVATMAGTKVKARPLAPAIRPTNRISVVRLPDHANADLLAAFRTALTEAASASG